MSNHPIPFVDLGALHASIGDELDEAWRRTVTASSFVGGAPVKSFEAAFAAAHEVATSAACGSGTDALSLALRAAGVGPGDEVLVPAMTFVATAEAVVHTGAVPVLVDVDPSTLLLDPDDAARARTAATKAVLPVHLYGHLVPFTTIDDWRADGLLVIEDAAQAHLGRWKDELVGSHGNAACYSFYPGKNLGALGDGGAVTSTDAALVARVAKLRDHGRTDKYRHDEIGWCSRLDGLQAALLEVKLRHLPAWTAHRQALAARYAELLPEVDGVSLVPWEDGAVHHLLCIRVEAGRRDAIQSALKEAGVGVGVHYPIALSQQPSCLPFHRSTPNAEAAASELVSLPIDSLMPLADVDEVVDRLAAIVGT
jgi:dTDP-4-amino-4,6-dideoxygalactose transaminase